MRLEKSIKNSIASLILEFVSIISGLILPRLILSHFGSAYNGLTSSIAQFISCAALLKSGINSVTRAALYKVLANDDLEGINRIVNASRKFLKKIAFIFLGILLGIAGLYPLLVAEEFSWIFTASLILIVGASSFFQYYFGVTYHTLLQADQKEYVYTIIHIGTVIGNLIISVILLELGCGIHLVKLGSAVVFIMNPMFLVWYVHRHYKLDKTVPADMSLIKQRWDAFGHQVATFIHSNTDVIILTIFTSTSTVSIYNIYYLAAVVIRKLMTSLSSGVEAAFGNMLVSENKDYTRKVFSTFETLIFGFSIILYSTALLLITPFAMLYTKGINDANYYQPLFALFLIAAEFFNCIRIPYQTVSNADGQYRKTKKWAYAEAAVNITVSLVLVNIFGLIGVAIGTLCAMILRTISYMFFSSKRVIERNSAVAIKNVLLAILICALIVFSGNLLIEIVNIQINSWLVWILAGAVIFMASSIAVFLIFLIFKHRELKQIFSIIKTLFRKITNKFCKNTAKNA